MRDVCPDACSVTVSRRYDMRIVAQLQPKDYAGEVVGYFREEDEVVFYHKAELKDKS